MSVANLEKPVRSKRTTPVIDRPQVGARPASRPKTRPEVRMRVDIQERRGAQPRSAVMMAAMVFVGFFTASYATSSLAGQVMVEKARRLEISARERAREARRTEASLRARVDALTSATSVESWALTHGFTVPKPAGEETEERAGYVAHR
ncbi:MAG: hypothetical protein ACO1SV_15390 [Fimbriimonas sp.]